MNRRLACPLLSLVTTCCLALPGCAGDDPGGAGADAGGDANGSADARPDGSAGGPGKVTPAPEGAPYATLAEWNLFSDAAKQIPNDRVVPYTVNSPLFADYASKHRFLYVPEGETIGYEAEATWRFPVGTILVKTFSYLSDTRDAQSVERLLETRLLVRESSGWRPYTYVWNEAQTETSYEVAGARMTTSFIAPDGEAVENRYVVPNLNECRECHGQVADTLGGRTRQLDLDFDYGSGPENQIDHLAALGLFDRAPEPSAERERLVDPFGDAEVEERMRAYFDGNCGHCHHPGNVNDSGSGLYLDYADTDPGVREAGTIGICKIPTSAGGATCGLTFDVVPGDPERSIMYCRLASEERQVNMPPLGRNLAHAEGAALLREWIESLEGSCD